MIEFTAILLQFFVFLVFSIPSLFIFNKSISKIYNFSFFENLVFNLLIFFNLILFLSLYKLNLKEIIFSYLVFLLIIYFLNLINFKNFKNKIINSFNIYYIILIFIICFVIFIDIASDATLSWDAEKFWVHKTLNFYNGYDIENLVNVKKPYYPYLGNLIWSFFWKLSFIDHEYSGRLFYGFFFVISIFLLSSNLNLSTIYKSIFSVLFVILTYEYFFEIFNGDQDILIFSLIAISMHCFYRLSNYSNINKNLYIFFIALIINSLIWIKQEGMISSFIILLTLIIFFKLNFRQKLILIFSYSLFMILRIIIFNHFNFNNDILLHDSFTDFSIQSIFNKIVFYKYILILKYFLIANFKYYLLVPGFLILILSYLNKQLFKKISYVYFFLLLNFIFLLAVYTMTDKSVEFMLNTTLDRLIYQFSPSIILVFIEYINSAKNKIKQKKIKLI